MASLPDVGLSGQPIAFHATVVVTPLHDGVGLDGR